MTLVKVLPKKIFFKDLPLVKIIFWLKLFLGALFTKVICTFLKSVGKDGFFDDPFNPFKEKKFSFHSRVSVYFLVT
jgi:hypothetical protein